MMFPRTSLGTTRPDHKKKHTGITKILNVSNIIRDTEDCQNYWLHDISSLKTKRTPKQALEQKPTGRRQPESLRTVDG